MKCIDSVKPLRPKIPTIIFNDQKAMSDLRWRHRPLFQFALDVSLPAAEKLVLICVASYRDPEADEFDRFGTVRPEIHRIRRDTNLPLGVVRSTLNSLNAAGYIGIDRDENGADAYYIAPLLPRLFEYFSLSGMLEGTLEDEEEYCEAISRLIKVSAGIRNFLTLEILSLETIEWTYPGLYKTYIKPWFDAEIERERSDTAESDCDCERCKKCIGWELI